VFGGAVLIAGAALLALVLPVYASGSDSTVSCGTLVFRHRFPLTEEFCVEGGSYETRRRVVLGMTGLGIGGVLIGAWRSGHRLVEACPQALRVAVGLFTAVSLAVVILSARPIGRSNPGYHHRHRARCRPRRPRLPGSARRLA
jgi:hypothetical protein